MYMTMYLQNVLSRETFLKIVFCWCLQGQSGSGSISQRHRSATLAHSKTPNYSSLSDWQVCAQQPGEQLQQVPGRPHDPLRLRQPLRRGRHTPGTNTHQSCASGAMMCRYIDEGVVGSGMGLFLLGRRFCHKTQKGGQLNVCIVYVYCVWCTLFSSCG
jgi:hypothetical protein